MLCLLGGHLLRHGDINKQDVKRTYIDGLVHERCNSSALSMELRLSYINPLIYTWQKQGQA